MNITKLHWKQTNEVLGAFIIENDEVVNIHPKGTHNGYIILGILHPYYGIDYPEINKKLDEKYLEPPHGGITFGKVIFNFRKKDLQNKLDKLYPELKNINYHILGFDTCHVDDNEIIWNQEAVKGETIRFAETMSRLMDIS